MDLQIFSSRSSGIISAVSHLIDGLMFEPAGWCPVEVIYLQTINSFTMKKIIFFAAFFAAVIGFTLPAAAQEANSLSPILNTYYGIKDALVAGDAKAAAARAADMTKAVDGVDMKSLPMKDHMAYMSLKDKLSSDARRISGSGDLAKQREYFKALSMNMGAFAKQAHLSAEPVYQEYCPMQKAYWLSSDSSIKNPYYGSSMLTCGKVTATLKP